MFEDRASGARTDRADLRAALDYVRDGKVLVVWKKAVTPGGQNAQLRGHWARLVLARLGISGVKVASEPADLAETAWGNPGGYHPGWVYHGLLIGPAVSAALLLHRLLGGALLPPALLSEMLSPHPVGGPIPGRPW